MSFGLGRGKALDPAPGEVLIEARGLPPLPDDVLTNPAGGWLDLTSWFPEPERPLHIEIGPGKGAFLVEQAGLHPGANYLGVEWAYEFCAYAADRVRRRRASAGTHANIRLICADATELLRWRVATASVAVIHLYFSDPWPKPRHHKKRVVQDRFLADAWRALEPGGELRVVTDHDGLWAWDEAHFARWTDPAAAPSVGELLPAGLFETAGGGGGLGASAPFALEPFRPPAGAREGELIGTNFERKFRPVKASEGGEFHAAVLRRRP